MKKTIAIIVLCTFIAFILGAGWGAQKALREVVVIGQEVLDIQLSQRAIDAITANPKLALMIMERNVPTEENPFNHPQANLQFSYCMIKYDNYTLCYDNQIRKYGEFIKYTEIGSSTLDIKLKGGIKNEITI